MTVAETARELNVGVMYVYTLIRGGLIAATKVDGVWDITPESVAERKETVAAFARKQEPDATSEL